MIGLGRMGFGMSERLLNKKFKVVGFNRSPEKVEALKEKGSTPAYTIEELLEKLPEKKIVWLMLPAGKPTDDMIKQLILLLKKGDIIIDGANDFYENAEKHESMCKPHGIHFFDCGVSGGVHGLKNGFTLMIGGPKEEFRYIEPFCKALAPEKGYGHFGPTGSGHFVKSTHNIIEYVYLQGLAEGVEILSKFKHPIDLKKATEVWKPASVINSWLLDLTNKALNRPDFDEIGTEIGSVTIGELQDTKEAVKAYAPAFDEAVKIRKSKGKEAEKFELGKRTISAVRNEFGGHAVEKEK